MNNDEMQFGYNIEPGIPEEDPRKGRHIRLAGGFFPEQVNPSLGTEDPRTVAERTTLLCAAYEAMEAARRARFDLSVRFALLIFQIAAAAAVVKVVDVTVHLVALALGAAVIASVCWWSLARAARTNFHMKMEAVRELEKFAPLRPVAAEASWLRLEHMQWRSRKIGAERWPVPAAYREDDASPWVPVNLRNWAKGDKDIGRALNVWRACGPTDKHASLELIGTIEHTLGNRDHRYGKIEDFMPVASAVIACVLIITLYLAPV